ncbi:MAG: helix-hairpin-helix domain-containing protein [Bacteroidota bacterium]
MRSHFNFNKQQRSGIFFLLVLIIILQLGYFGLNNYPVHRNTGLFEPDMENQVKFDSLVIVSKNPENIIQRPFNPNFISDYKGYTLGIAPSEIDRLYQFRAQGKFVNSAEEFQKVTEVSDSLLTMISPFFRFPDWAKETSKSTRTAPQGRSIKKIRDLNLASIHDLKKIQGIGEKLSVRIIKFRDRLGGFLVNEQLYDVYGLKPEVVQSALQQFQVLNPPQVKKVNINTASVEEIATLVYLRYQVAENIVIYREKNGAFASLNDLFNVSGFPINKIDRIGLYLSY